MSHTFISYAREDINIAERIFQALAENDLNTWVDWKNIPKAEDWKEEIFRGIEESDSFLFLITTDSVTSQVCNEEIDHALKNGKRIIPILIGNTKEGKVYKNAYEITNKFFFQHLEGEINRRNFIFCREGLDDFNKAIEQIKITIRTDYKWVEFHTNLQLKAIEWDHEKDESFLLHGKELEKTEAVFNKYIHHTDPEPTKIQQRYILESSIAENSLKEKNKKTRYRVLLLFIATALSVVAAIWSGSRFGSAFLGQQEAIANEQLAKTQGAETAIAANIQNTQIAATAGAANTIALASQLASQAVAQRDSDFSLSLLLGIEAFQILDTPETRGILLDNSRDHPQLLNYLNYHTQPITSVEFSPTGQLFASSDIDNKIILWDAETQKPFGQPLTESSYPAQGLSFSPDGQVLVSIGCANVDVDDFCTQGEIILWDVNQQKIIKRSNTNEGDVANSVAFHPSGKIFAIGGGSKTTLWNAETLQPFGNPLDEHSTNYYSTVNFSPDGRTLVSASCGQKSEIGLCNQGEILIWDVNTQFLIGRLVDIHTDTITSITFSSDGKMFASGSRDQTIILWNAETYQPIGQPLRGHTHWVTAVDFNQDGSKLASGSIDNTVILWDTKTQQQTGPTLRGHKSTVNAISFNPQTNILASGGDDGTIILWDPSKIQHMNKLLTGHTKSVNSVAISPDNKTLASGSEDHTIIFWNTNTGLPISKPLEVHNDSVTSVTFSPNGQMLASGSIDATILLWDTTNYQPIGEPLPKYFSLIYSVAFHPNSQILAAGSADYITSRWDINSRKLIGEPLFDHMDSVSSVTFSPDGSLIASGSADNTIVIWNADEYLPEGRFVQGTTSSINSVTFSPDGKALAAGGWNNTINLWDVESLQRIDRPFTGHLFAVNSVTFNPNGKILASGSDDNTIILWDVETGQAIGQPLTGHSDSVNSIAFSQDGKLLASGSADNTIILWDVDPLTWIQESCQRAGRNLTHTEWTQYFPDKEYRKTCDQWDLEP